MSVSCQDELLKTKKILGFSLMLISAVLLMSSSWLGYGWETMLTLQEDCQEWKEAAAKLSLPAVKRR